MLTYLSENIWAVWLIAAVLFLLLEAATTSLVSVWFVPSAVIVSVVSLWLHSIAAQLILFILLSGAFMFLFRKFYRKKAPASKLKEANDLLIGKTAVAETDISPLDGKVLVGDVYWRAVTEDESIPEGTTVEIRSVEGTTLTVSAK